MKTSKSLSMLCLIFLMGSFSSAFADRIQLVQGKRAIQDQVTFTVDVLREKYQNPRFENAPEDIQIILTFRQDTTGMVYIDGKAIGRFDETSVFSSNLADITYGRHTVTLITTSPSVVSQFYVTVRGGIVREFLNEQAIVPSPVGLEPRIAELERKIQTLETEMATLKKQKRAVRKQ